MEIRKSNLNPSGYYHVFNRGINGSKVFFEFRNYHYFLARYFKYVGPFVDTFAYCLMANHFHLLFRVKEEEKLTHLLRVAQDKPLYWHISNAIGSFLQSYTRAIHNAYERSGAIFETPFKRIPVEDEEYFRWLLLYIHRNAENHGVVPDYKLYVHSSFHLYMSDESTQLATDEVINWFGGRESFVKFHEHNKEAVLVPVG